ncbi:hypothetical protein Glove_138g24 [Diversispora epigaea]|uniref:ABC transporter domain-containing protein n=1 Tax=Diversispora epigaea TaxID=1348612 RepID=A0A397IW31_9GLOM|nr:hypothetical protein Glove_138g24 [Diversispora epigaea]
MTDNNFLSPNIITASGSGSATSLSSTANSGDATSDNDIKNKLSAQEEIALHSRGGIQLIFRQLWIMLKKNFILQLRYRKSTLAQILIGPLIFLLLLFILQKSNDAQQLRSNLHPLTYPLIGVQPCQGRTRSAPCINFMFTPNTVDTKNIMEMFAINNEKRTGNPLIIEDISITNDNLGFLPEKTLGIVPVTDETVIYNYTLMHPNTTLFAIHFDFITSTPKNYRYQIWFNGTLMANQTDIMGDQVLAFQRGIDEAIVSLNSGLNKNSANLATFNVQLKDWPKVPPTQLNDQIVASFGALFFFCAEMIIFINVLNTIVTEKEYKLKDSLLMMGLNREIYWISNFLSNAWIVTICSLVICIFGIAFRFFVFKNANFGVLFITFLLFGLAMVSFAFFVTTFCHRSRVAILIGIFIFIIGLLFQFFVFSDTFLGYIWWSDKISSAGWKVLVFFPFFNFGKIYLDLTQMTAGNLDYFTLTVIPGHGFSWNDLYNKLPDDLLPPMDPSNTRPNTPPPIHSWYFLLMNIGVYSILTWYLDKVIPDEFGNYHNPLFFLTPSYYGIKFNRKLNQQNWLNRNKRFGLNENNEGEDEKVSKERERAFDPNQNLAIRICNLSKIYQNSFFVKSLLDKVAVNNLCLTVKEGKCLALLGQNGAGKSTTMNILSGLTPSSKGDALLYGYSVKSDMNSIRKIMGICPQHDILFNELTAREHIELYAGIKNIPHSEIDKLVEERLASVRLTKVANIPAGSYSGGMKRRLSMLISTIGDPRIIFLDEPTTGMDPVNRRHVWSFIEKFKKGRVIILTTHSMEEADVLGDRICVMAHGRLRAIGNSIHLKNKFGAGYRISLVTHPNDAARLKNLIETKVPEVLLDDDSAGALIYELPISGLASLPPLIQWLEENKEMSQVDPEKKLLKAWGVSQKSLEEAFLRLIREANPNGYSGYENNENNENDENSGLRRRNVPENLKNTI